MKKTIRLQCSLVLLVFVMILWIRGDVYGSNELEQIQKAIREKGTSWTAGENWVTRLSREERRKLCGTIIEPPDPSQAKLLSLPPIDSLPSVFDWRDNNGNWVTPVRDQGPCGSCWDFSAVEAYDPDTNTWMPKAPMPTARSWLSSSTVDGKIYAIGGLRGSVSVATVEEYDPSSDLTTVEEVSEATAVPSGFALSQNYPNPFNPSTTIRFNLPKSSFVTLKIFDTLGKEITTLVNEKKSSGEYTID